MMLFLCFAGFRAFCRAPALSSFLEGPVPPPENALGCMPARMRAMPVSAMSSPRATKDFFP